MVLTEFARTQPGTRQQRYRTACLLNSRQHDSIHDLQVLRLVYELKQAGHFTAVALTRPFEFEGRRRAEAAETLISALEEAAHFVTVIEQVFLPTDDRLSSPG